jgi:hypothetical protein
MDVAWSRVDVILPGALSSGMNMHFPLSDKNCPQAGGSG